MSDMGFIVWLIGGCSAVALNVFLLDLMRRRTKEDWWAILMGLAFVSLFIMWSSFSL